MTKDGGPAFPCTTGSDGGLIQSGMSLRDYFAGMALGNMAREIESGYCERESYKGNYENRARNAYKYADAMLAEREKAVPAE